MHNDDPNIDDLFNCEGMLFLNRMKVYSYSYHCFEMNMIELVASLESLGNEGNALIIWSVDDQDKKHFVFQEVIRRFHNMVASAKSLVEHTRLFVDEHYKGVESIDSAYREEVKKLFAENGNAAIIEDLRNYFMHAGIPPLRMQLHLETGAGQNGGLDIKNQIFIEIKELKSWGRWKSQSKKHLAAATGDFDLLALVSEYKKTVNSFHIWFSDLLRNHHSEDTAELRNLDAAFRETTPSAKAS